MRSILRAADYTSTSVFETEERALFRRLWILAGFRSLLDAPDAFVTHRIGGVPVVIQNTTAGLRAYVNRCAHRHAPVQIDDFGTRRLACPYHGWVYDGDGRVRSIPGNEANYGFDGACVAALRLEPVALRIVGGLVFVNLAPDPMPLEAQFHPAFLERAAHASGFVGDTALFAKFDAGYNWKLNFENVVDRNHVPFVHAASFASLAPSLKPPAPGTRPPSPPPQPDAEIGDDLRELSFDWQASFDLPSWPWHEAIERCARTEDYVNYFLYPNVNYIVMSGAIHLIQQYCPAAPDRTEYRITMALGRRTKRLPAAPAILWSQLKSEKRVIDEDTVVLEALQRGLANDAPPAFHGAGEYRLRRIAKVYRKLMEAA